MSETNKTNPAPSLATLGRLVTEASELLAIVVTRRIDEARPAFEALRRLGEQDQRRRP